MKVERPKMISRPLRLWAASCAIVWLLGVSVAVVAQVCSCCDSSRKGCGRCENQSALCGDSGTPGGCAEHKNSGGGCCDKEQSNQSCGIGNGCSLNAMELKPALPFQFCSGLLLSLPAIEKNQPAMRLVVPSEAPISVTRHDLDQAVPPELRLGSALWSHAPPMRHA
jgi:hypothetical protein